MEGSIFQCRGPGERGYRHFVADRRQALLNNRVLASVEPSLELTPADGGGSDAALSFAIVDTQNLIALPEPKYDSNTGLTIESKGRDYDFLGSMQTLDLDLSYVSEAADNRYFEIATDFFLPFRALGADWNFGDPGKMRRSGLKASLSRAARPAWRIAFQASAFPRGSRRRAASFYNSDLPETSYTNPSLTPYYSSLVEPDPLAPSRGSSRRMPPSPSTSRWGPGRVSFTPKRSLTANWWPTPTYPIRFDRARLPP